MLSIRTLLFSDVEGSTSLLDRAGSQYRALLNEHRRMVRAALEHVGGIEHGTEGDSFFLSFDSPTAALAAAVEAQRSIEKHDWPDGLRLRVRMGIHVGEVQEDGDHGFVGMSIHHAARIAAAAHGGQIVLSDAVRQMTGELPERVEIRPLGTHRLRDVGAVALFQVDHPDLQHDFPSPRGILGYRTNLPRSRTTFIGGEAMVEAIADQSAAGNLVTLTGTGGVGKTRLAVELGWSRLDQFDDGVWMIELAPVANPESVVGAVASTLSIPLQNGMTHIESIIDWLNGRNAMLILDNCEHVLDGARPLLSRLLGHCPTMAFVATSRQPLEVSGERVLIVNVLSPEVDAVALFLDRASAADTSFVPNDAERRVVADVCRRLDGLPLAIELAAARMRSMSPAELLGRLDDRFELLRRAGSGVDHHDVLQATVEWSYRLLNDRERAVFDRLSVFAGGFDLRAADAVCNAHHPATSGGTDALSTLVDKSMIVAERQLGGTRYNMLETMRQFGNKRLHGDELRAVRDRHLQHYVQLAQETSALFLSPRQVDGASIFHREWDNLRLAHQQAIAVEDLQRAEEIVIALHRFADSQNRLELGQWVDQTLALATSERVPRPHTYALGAFWAYAAENDSRGDELLARGIEIAAGSFDDPGSLMCLTMAVRRQQKDAAHLEDSRTVFMQVEEIASRIDLDQEWWVVIELADHAYHGHPEAEAAHLLRLVDMSERLRIPALMSAAALEMGHAADLEDRSDLERALTFFAKARSIARDSNDLICEGAALRGIARASVSVEPADARAACHEALMKLYDIRYWLGIWRVMESAALHLVAVGQLADAAVLLGNLEAHHSKWGTERILGFRERSLLGVRQHARAEECMARGAAMDRHQIVEYALSALDT